MFVVEDGLHAETMAKFRDREAAVSELRRLAEVPWDQEPNQAPCRTWRTCCRIYEIREFEVEAGQWSLLNRWPAFEISADGVQWDAGFRATI